MATLADCDDALDLCRHPSDNPGGGADRDLFCELFRERLEAEGCARGRDDRYISADMSPDDA